MSTKAPSKRAKRPASTKKSPRKGAASKTAKKTPCEACKGFAVPGRIVSTVARDARGRFRKAAQRGLI